GLADRYAGETTAPVAALKSDSPQPPAPTRSDGHTTSPHHEPPRYLLLQPRCSSRLHPNEDPLIRRGSNSTGDSDLGGGLQWSSVRTRTPWPPPPSPLPTPPIPPSPPPPARTGNLPFRSLAAPSLVCLLVAKQ
uniref:Uncharacterized protein n=1 Tax=Aegilops tauschii subsp. strangulata TaxID=200361 RepID=A0A453AUR2_AEGTS